MPSYAVFSRLTPSGRQTLHREPSRVAEVNREIEKLGCQIVEQYALLGEYDFLTFIEAPDNASVAHLCVDLESRGTMSVVAFPAVAVDALQAALLDPEDQLGSPRAGQLVSTRP